MSGLADQLRESLRAIGDVFGNPGLRRLQFAWIGSVTGDWAYAIALAVFAYEAGGATAVGLVALLRFLPSAAVAPFAAVLADRYPRQRVMLAADAIRAVALAGAAAVALADGPAPAVYALAALVAVVSTAFQPAQAALIPTLARDPRELTAANVASSTIESVGSFLGPAIGGLLLAVTSPGVVFAATAGAFVWSALNVARIPASPPAREDVVEEALHREALAGFRAIFAHPSLRLVVGLYSAQTLVAGALNVLVIVAALELLDLGRSGPGLLNSAVGIGGLIGAGVALGLVGMRGLGTAFAFGLVLWGLPLVLFGAWPTTGAAVLFLGLLGIGNTLVDVSGLTLLQRTAPPEVLGRVFGVLESLVVGTLGLGAIIAPLLVSLFGVRWALVATGLLLPALALASWPRLRTIDERAVVPRHELERLRSLPLFAPLPPATLEHLATNLVRVPAAAGSEITRQGDVGDRFYLVDGGELEVSSDGQVVSALGPGDYFGEIALLRDVPRTATVTAKTDAALLALERDEFVSAVTGHPASLEAADAVVAARLGRFRPGLASI
ncbi:MAG TPA: MFS transporter [Gaiellaceae bacterium]|nr:MFS transporter [Gaiellaceae bacterium]